MNIMLKVGFNTTDKEIVKILLHNDITFTKQDDIYHFIINKENSSYKRFIECDCSKVIFMGRSRITNKIYVSNEFEDINCAINKNKICRNCNTVLKDGSKKWYCSEKCKKEAQLIAKEKRSTINIKSRTKLSDFDGNGDRSFFTKKGKDEAKKVLEYDTDELLEEFGDIE